MDAPSSITYAEYSQRYEDLESKQTKIRGEIERKKALIASILQSMEEEQIELLKVENKMSDLANEFFGKVHGEDCVMETTKDLSITNYHDPRDHEVVDEVKIRSNPQNPRKIDDDIDPCLENEDIHLDSVTRPGMWRLLDIELGKGASSTVFMGLNCESGKFMAIKETLCDDKNVFKAFTNEIRVMKTLEHENIVKYLGSEQRNKKMFIFMEFVQCGSIEMLREALPFNESMIQRIVVQIVRGLIYLQKRGVVHRDLKAGNVLCDDCGNVKITDFGSSTFENLDQEHNKCSYYGTPQMWAPEIFKNGSYTSKSDIWALGCTIFQMIMGCDPWMEIMQKFDTNSPSARIEFVLAMRKIIESEDLMKKLDVLNLPTKMIDFIACCLQKDPKKRYSAVRLYNHPWMEDVKTKNNKMCGSMK